jgi:trk system potassium uptake protein TrkA
LKDLSFPKDSVIGGVIRGSESMIAIGTTKIEAYDWVVVFALPHAVKEVDKFFKQ